MVMEKIIIVKISRKRFSNLPISNRLTTNTAANFYRKRTKLQNYKKILIANLDLDPRKESAGFRKTTCSENNLNMNNCLNVLSLQSLSQSTLHSNIITKMPSLGRIGDLMMPNTFGSIHYTSKCNKNIYLLDVLQRMPEIKFSFQRNSSRHSLTWWGHSWCYLV